MKHYKLSTYILIIFNIVIGFTLYKYKTELDRSIEKYWNCHFQLNYIIDNIDKLTTLSILQYHAENQTVENIKLYSKNNKNIFLSDIVSNSPKLIFYYSEKGCSACYEPFLYRLDSISNSIGIENIIVISDFSNHRSFTVATKNKFNNLNIYRTEEKIKIINDKEYNYAYSFLIKSDMIANKVIITDKSNTNISNEYLNYMIEYFKRIKK